MNLSKSFLVLLAAMGGAFACHSRTKGLEPLSALRQATGRDAGTEDASTAEVGPKPVREEDLLYLEEIDGPKVRAFVESRHAKTEALLTKIPGFTVLEDRLASILGSQTRIPWPSVRGKTLTNFWTDTEHPRGLWRKTTLADYKNERPRWETLLDVDALGQAEKESLVFEGANCLPPRKTKCLVQLSKGGSDALVVREFDAQRKEFVPKGFQVGEAKTTVEWRDDNVVFVATDFGPESLTRSGYPRRVKQWQRGTPLANAPVVFEVAVDDLGASCRRVWDHGRAVDLCERGIDMDRAGLWVLRKNALVPVPKPDDAEALLWDSQWVLRLKSPWSWKGQTFKKGSLLAVPFEEFLAGQGTVQVLYEPSETSFVESVSGTKSYLFVTLMTDVKSEVIVFSRKGGSRAVPRWNREAVKLGVASVHVAPLDGDFSDDVWLTLEDFTAPPSLVLYNHLQGRLLPYKRQPSDFDAKDITTVQHFAPSKDGTAIPYFEVGRSDRKGPAPTLLYAYGGFEISLRPWYSGEVGAAWLESGGVYVVANLRGGGEYGPAWHEAAIKHSRQVAFDDMAAVAEDLQRRGVTTNSALGIRGQSNGGLLTSVMLTQRPELFGAVVSEVPLTDMRRYHKLLAGSSWMSEYGDPENNDDWSALSRYSPLQNAGRKKAYPPALFMSSTKDDRVHPAHARKMVAMLESLGHAPLYFENFEGGHGSAADLRQRAHHAALVYTFLKQNLTLKP